MGRRDLTFGRLAVANRARSDASYHPIAEWSPTDWACAMGGECGEALNLVKKLRRITGPTCEETLFAIHSPAVTMLLPMIGRELADVVIYADLLATRLGLDLGDCIRDKFNATSEKIRSDVRI